MVVGVTSTQNFIPTKYINSFVFYNCLKNRYENACCPNPQKIGNSFIYYIYTAISKKKKLD